MRNKGITQICFNKLLTTFYLLDLKTLSTAMDINRTLQYLGLSHNKIKSINPFLVRIGKLPFPSN